MSSLQLGVRVGGHLALTDFGPEESQWTLAYGYNAVDDSTINIVVVIIIIIR